MLKPEGCLLGPRLLANLKSSKYSNLIIITGGTFNFLLSAEGACMSAADDSNLPEVEKIPLVIDAEFTEEEEIQGTTSSLNEISS